MLYMQPEQARKVLHMVKLKTQLKLPLYLMGLLNMPLPIIALLKGLHLRQLVYSQNTTPLFPSPQSLKIFLGRDALLQDTSLNDGTLTRSQPRQSPPQHCPSPLLVVVTQGFPSQRVLVERRCSLLA